MKKITLIISVVFMSSCASSQTLSADSLGTSIRMLQKQIAVLQQQINNLSKVHVINFDPQSFNVVSTDSLNQSVSLKTVSVDLTSVNSAIKSLQTKISTLKATSVTTTTIQ